MELGRQTASVVSSPLKQVIINDTELQNNAIGLLGCLNPESHNQKDLFYFSPTTYRIRLTDNDTTKLPAALSNPQYPNSYEMLFYDRGSDSSNPEGWVNLSRVNARNLLQVSKNTVWDVKWDFDGKMGLQTATVNGATFSRVTTLDNSNRTGFSPWRINRGEAYGATRASVINSNATYYNNMGWASPGFMLGTGIDQETYPECYKSISQTITDKITNDIFETVGNAGKIFIRLKQTIRDLDVFIGYPAV